MFSKEFIEEMKQRLLEDKAKIQKELGVIEAKHPNEAEDLTVAFPNYTSEMGDEEGSAQEVADYEVNLNVEQDLKSTLRDIDNALERITTGTYGICRYCKKAIPEERLRARPTSGSCVECKKTIVQEA